MIKDRKATSSKSSRVQKWAAQRAPMWLLPRVTAGRQTAWEPSLLGAVVRGDSLHFHPLSANVVRVTMADAEPGVRHVRIDLPMAVLEDHQALADVLTRLRRELHPSRPLQLLP